MDHNPVSSFPFREVRIKIDASLLVRVLSHFESEAYAGFSGRAIIVYGYFVVAVSGWVFLFHPPYTFLQLVKFFWPLFFAMP